MIIIILIKKEKVIVFFGITHVLMGISLYVLLFGFDFMALLFVSIGSLLPDIDTQYSKFGKYNPLVGIMKHRGFTHTIISCFLVSFIIALWNVKLGLSLGFGYFIHLLSDYLTPMGIMWLYPYNKKYYTLSTKNYNLRTLEGIIFGVCMLYLFLGKIK